MGWHARRGVSGNWEFTRITSVNLDVTEHRVGTDPCERGVLMAWHLEPGHPVPVPEIVTSTRPNLKESRATSLTDDIQYRTSLAQYCVSTVVYHYPVIFRPLSKRAITCARYLTSISPEPPSPQGLPGTNKGETDDQARVFCIIKLEPAPTWPGPWLPTTRANQPPSDPDALFRRRRP